MYIEHIKLVKVSHKYCLTARKALLCVLPEERTRLRCWSWISGTRPSSPTRPSTAWSRKLTRGFSMINFVDFHYFNIWFSKLCLAKSTHLNDKLGKIIPRLQSIINVRMKRFPILYSYLKKTKFIFIHSDSTPYKPFQWILS